MRRSRILCGLMLVLMHGCLLLCVGCDLFRFAKPETTLRAGPWGNFFSFHDTKDNDIEFRDGKYNPKTGEAAIGWFRLRNNSTDPINAYVNQMKVMVEQQAMVNEAMKIAFNGLSDLVGQTIPLVNVLRRQVETLTTQPAVAGTVSGGVAPD